jgi:hypothetical protein
MSHRLTPTGNPSWPTARDIAGLPGMPGTVRGIHKRAEVQGWPSTTEPVRGGLQVRYDPTVLPAETRLALAARITTIGADGTEQEQLTTVAAQLQQRTSLIIQAPARQLSQADANRTRVLVLFQRFWSAIGGALHPALEQFALLWTTGRIDAPEALRLAVPTLTTPTLRRWWLALEEQGTLARQPHPKRDQFAALTGEVGTAVLAILATKPHLSATAVRSLLLKHGAVPADQVPSERAFQRALKAFKTDNAQTPGAASTCPPVATPRPTSPAPTKSGRWTARSATACWSIPKPARSAATTSLPSSTCSHAAACSWSPARPRPTPSRP